MIRQLTGITLVGVGSALVFATDVGTAAMCANPFTLLWFVESGAQTVAEVLAVAGSACVLGGVATLAFSHPGSSEHMSQPAPDTWKG